MKSKLLALLLGTSVILGACGGGDEPKEESTGTTEGSSETASGDAEAIVQKNCIGCHGENLEGSAGPNLTKVGAKYDKDEIQNIILHGQGGMPGGLLEEADAEVVATWLADKK